MGTLPKNKKLKELGWYQRENMCEAVESFSMGFLTRVMNWSIEEVQVLVAKARKELRDPKVRMFVLVVELPEAKIVATGSSVRLFPLHVWTEAETALRRICPGSTPKIPLPELD